MRKIYKTLKRFIEKYIIVEKYNKTNDPVSVALGCCFFDSFVIFRRQTKKFSPNVPRQSIKCPSLSFG